MIYAPPPMLCNKPHTFDARENAKQNPDTFLTWLSHDHLMSPLGGRVLLFEFSCGAVPPWADEAVDALDWSLNRTPISRPPCGVRIDDDGGSSRIPGAAIEDRDARSIDVLLVGRRLLLDVEPFESSELVLRTPTCACGPSRLLGRYNVESPLLDGTAIRLGVTLPSTKDEGIEPRPACVGVMGVDMLLCNGGVNELVRFDICPGRGRPPLELSCSCSRFDLANSLAIFLTRTAVSFSARRCIASKRL